MAKKTTKSNFVTHDTITEAIDGVRQEIDGLIKDRTFAPGKNYEYDYASQVLTVANLRPLLIKHGIIRYRTKSENKGRFDQGLGVDIDQTYRYMLKGAKEMVEGITFLDQQTSGSGKSPSDGGKACMAAATTGSKYADWDMFYLPIVDDLEDLDEVNEIRDIYFNREVSNADQVIRKEDEEEEEKKKTTKKRSTKKTSKSKKGKKSEPEPEEEEDEEEEEKSKKKTSKKARSSKRNKKKKEEEPEPEEEEDEEEGVDLDELDYDDPEVKEMLTENLDLTDVELIDEYIESFEDREQLKAFFEILQEIAKDESSKFAREFTDDHFGLVQECFEELS